LVAPLLAPNHMAEFVKCEVVSASHALHDFFCMTFTKILIVKHEPEDTVFCYLKVFT